MLIHFLGLRIGRERRLSQAERLRRRGQLSGDAWVVLGRGCRRTAGSALAHTRPERSAPEALAGHDGQTAKRG